MHHNTLASSLLVALSMTIWALIEIAFIEDYASDPGIAIFVALAWGVGYVLGFRIGGKLVSDESRWRLPFLLVSFISLAMMEFFNYDFSTEFWSGITVYFIASLQLGLVVSSLTTVLINLTDYESWPKTIFSLRGLSSLLYIVFTLAISYTSIYDIMSLVTAIKLVLVSTGIASLAIFFRIRRPAIRESLLKNLDKFADAAAFGEGYLIIQGRQLMVLAYLTSLVGILRVLALQESGLELSPVTITLYGLFYSLGAAVGILAYSPPLIILSVVGAGMLSLVTSGFVELSFLLISAGLAEVGLMRLILESEPTRLGRVMGFITMSMVVITSLLVVVHNYLGLDYEYVIVFLFLLAPFVSKRSPSWY